MTASVARVAAIALTGVEGTAVTVEAAMSNQLPGITIIGLPDTAIAEAKQRVRLAAQRAGIFSAERHVVINLSPAALPKHGSGFDLAIALALAAASGQVPGERMAAVGHFGELSLDGGLRRPPGLLSAILAARGLGFTRVMVPESCTQEASLVPDIEVIGVRDLRGAAAWYRDASGGWSIASPAPAIPEDPKEHAVGEPDMAEIIGQPEAVEAMVIAAAGRHNLLMVGPPGAGKTLLASRVRTILPDLEPDEQIIVSSIASLGGEPLRRLITRPPFENPHHTASAVAVIGGGDGGVVRPGAVTRATCGILFLDEAPQFSGAVLDSLRQPLESGTVEIHRARLRATLPADVQLILAANPCPCGKSGAPDTAAECRCSPMVRTRYLGRISGPLADRIDLRLAVRRVSSALPLDAASDRPSSAQLRERVTAARVRARERLAGTPWRVNAEVPGSWLRGDGVRLSRAATTVIDRALERGLLTMRGYDRALRVAWTLADLAGLERPGRDELARALSLREGAFL